MERSRRARRDDDESASAFLKRLGMRDDEEDAKRAQSFASGSFKRDFLERLAQAERRDEASEVTQQQISADALDAMLLVSCTHRPHLAPPRLARLASSRLGYHCSRQYASISRPQEPAEAEMAAAGSFSKGRGGGVKGVHPTTDEIFRWALTRLMRAVYDAPLGSRRVAWFM